MQANHVLLISPDGFSVNPETEASNAFQKPASDVDMRERVTCEHAALVDALRANGIEVLLLSPHRNDIPDAVFPNNWFSTHPDGRLVIYPMEAESRRREIRPGFPEELRGRGFEISDVIDLSCSDSESRRLEGTGSLVLDHEYRIAFAAESSRTHRSLVFDWCRDFAFEPFIFDASDPDGKPIYHTNVIMGIGRRAAVACLDVIADVRKRTILKEKLERDGREFIEISWSQVREFAGNVLFLAGEDAEIMMISQRGWDSLSYDQKERISRKVKAVPVKVDTLESVGGGSVRCMIAEIFLRRKST